MIHKIHTPRPSFKSIIQYAGDKIDAEIIGGNQPAFSTGELIKKFEQYENLCRKKPKAPVFHATLSLPVNEHLTDKEWQESVEIYLKKIGFDTEMNPFTIIKHKDTDNEHVHIIVGKTRLDGKNTRIPHNDYYRGMEACRHIEKKLNLKPEKKNPEKKAKPNAYEQKQAKRQGKDTTAKEKIQSIIDEIVENHEFNLQSETGRNFFAQELAKKDVSVKFTIQQNGEKMTGISFAFEKMAYKGTALGTNYKANVLTRRALHTDEKIKELWEETNEKIQKTKEKTKKLQESMDDYYHKLQFFYKAMKNTQDKFSQFILELLALCAELDRLNTLSKIKKERDEQAKEYENYKATKAEIKTTPTQELPKQQSAAGAALAPAGAGAEKAPKISLDSADLLKKAQKLAQTQAPQGLQDNQKTQEKPQKSRGR